MTHAEICAALEEWEGADVSFLSRAGDEIRASTVGRLYRDREREGAPDLACFAIREPVTAAADAPAVTLLDFAIGPEATAERVDEMLVVRQGDVAMEISPES